MRITRTEMYVGFHGVNILFYALRLVHFDVHYRLPALGTFNL